MKWLVGVLIFVVVLFGVVTNINIQHVMEQNKEIQNELTILEYS